MVGSYTGASRKLSSGARWGWGCWPPRAVCLCYTASWVGPKGYPYSPKSGARLRRYREAPEATAAMA